MKRLGLAWGSTMLGVLIGLGAPLQAVAAVPEPGACLEQARSQGFAGTVTAGMVDQAFDRYRDRLASAPDAEAREIALADVRRARGALATARVVAPFADGLDTAEARLDRYERNVREASSSEEVLASFDGLTSSHAPAVTAGPMNDVDADVGDCHYDNVEIIAIILGFLFFIIPGIILLILLC